MFISNNRTSLHLWWKENLVKRQKVSKYYENDRKFLTPWIWNTRYFEQNISYFENLESRLNSWYREDIYVLWLFLLVPNPWTVTKRRSAGLNKITINLNSNYDIVIINYVMIVLIILQIPSILLFTLWITSSTVQVFN